MTEFSAVRAYNPILLAYRRRVGAEELHELRRHPDPVRLTLLAAFCHVRGREIADALTELLITTVHRIGAKAEKRVEGELITDLGSTQHSRRQPLSNAAGSSDVE